MYCRGGSASVDRTRSVHPSPAQSNASVDKSAFPFERKEHADNRDRYETDQPQDDLGDGCHDADYCDKYKYYATKTIHGHSQNRVGAPLIPLPDPDRKAKFHVVQSAFICFVCKTADKQIPPTGADRSRQETGINREVFLKRT